MKTFLTALLGFIFGALVGAFGGGLIGTGAGAGAGIVTGMQAGACLVVEAAKDTGLIPPDRAGDLLAAAAASIRAEAEALKTDGALDAVRMTGEAECQTVVAKLRQAVTRH